MRPQGEAGIRRFLVLVCDPADDGADIFLAHSVGERGTNENQNGLIRRLVPKGTDLGTLSPQEVKAAEAWLNSYPRKMFGFLCSEQLFREELALILAR